MSPFLVPWRNLWRNRRRTAITVAGVSFNTMVLIATVCLMDGMLDQTVRNATRLMTGEAQLHGPDYLTDRSLYKTLDNADAILKALRDRSIGAAARVYGFGLVSQGTKSAGALFWGIEPPAEKANFDLATHMEEGEFLGPAPRKGLVLGKKLARALNAKIGSEIVVLVQSADGSMGNELFTVHGVFRAVGDGVDRNAALMHADDFRALFGMPTGIHEIAVNTGDRMPLATLTEVLTHLAPDADVKTWHQLLPVLSDMIQLSDANMILFSAIFLLAAGLGVMNTMLMATYERARELGLLKALGASPWRIVRDVALEAWLLAIVSSLAGALAGLAAGYALQEIGLDTSGLAGETTISGVVFDPVWRATVSVKAVLQPVFIMWGVCVLAALYPAAMSARMDPVKSMHQA